VSIVRDITNVFRPTRRPTRRGVIATVVGWLALFLAAAFVGHLAGLIVFAVLMLLVPIGGTAIMLRSLRS
jgi:hypothetical protein